MRAEAQAHIDRIDAALSLVRRFLDWDRALRRLDELNARVEDPTLWDDQKKAQEVMRERTRLDDAIGAVRAIEGLPPCRQCSACLAWWPGDGGCCPAPDCGAPLLAAPRAPVRVKATELVEVFAAQSGDERAAALVRYTEAAYRSAVARGSISAWISAPPMTIASSPASASAVSTSCAISAPEHVQPGARVSTM